MTTPFSQTRIVVLSNGHELGLRLLKSLERNGVVPVQTVLVSPPAVPRTGGHPTITPRAVGRWAREWLRFALARNRYRRAGANPIVGGAIGGRRLVRTLDALEPDYVLLGGVGILPAAVLATARHAVINAHPGLLPWVRGTGVVGGALLRGVPVGVTCHRVTAGIDLGDVFERRLLPVKGGETLETLERRADDLAVEMLAAIARRCVDGDCPPPVAQGTRYPICRWLTPAERAEVEGQLRDGLAKRVFDEWAIYADPHGHRLLDEQLHPVDR